MSINKYHFKEINELLSDSSIHLREVTTLNKKIPKKYQIIRENSEEEVLVAEIIPSNLQYFHMAIKELNASLVVDDNELQRKIQDQQRTIISLKDQQEARAQHLEYNQKQLGLKISENTRLWNDVTRLEREVRDLKEQLKAVQ
jgi:ABC-type uncharacterized transport system ATPase subunit